MRTKVAVSSVTGGGRKLVEVEVEVETFTNVRYTQLLKVHLASEHLQVVKGGS